MPMAAEELAFEQLLWLYTSYYAALRTDGPNTAISLLGVVQTLLGNMRSHTDGGASA